MKSLRAKLTPVRVNDNQLISAYIKGLIVDFELKDQSTHDVAIFQLNSFESSKQRVDDLSEDIRRNVPDSSPVHFSPLNQMIEDRNLRVAAFNIIVSDDSNPVSIKLGHVI